MAVRRPFFYAILIHIMYRQISKFIAENQMIKEGDTVVAGVSGGADSVCLLYMLSKYRETCPVHLIAVHVHHGLRENADGDEAYVGKLCESLNVPLKIFHIDAKKEAVERGVSVEEAGRIKRYELFRSVLDEEGDGKGKIAVAHHKDDLCETMLFQMFRGSGISGLRGMLPVSGDVIRPLLCTGRAEIEEYLNSEGISWRTDESNSELIYARNRIRHEIMPIAEEICKGASDHMAESAKRLSEIEEYIKLQAGAEKDKYIRSTKEGEKKSLLLLNETVSLPKALLGELILEALCEISGKKRDIGLVQVEAVTDLFSLQVGRKRELIYGILAEREYDGVRLSLEERGARSVTEAGKGFESAGQNAADDGNKSEQPDTEIQIPTDGTEFPLGEDYIVRAEILSDPDLKKIPADSYTKWLNYDTINNCLVFRHPKMGDFLTVNKEGGRKLLKDYFVNEKIPTKERENLWVLADGSRILWVVAHRIGEDAKITENTKNAIQIIIKEGSFHGRTY